MNRKWCGLLVGLVLPWTSALAAQGKAGKAAEIVIGVSLPLMGYPVYDEFRKGLEAEAAALGVKLDVSFAQFLAANQVEDLQRFVEDRVGGIVVSPVPKGSHGSDLDLGPTIDAAVSAGVPVAVGCGWAETDKALVRVIGDDAQAGRMAAKLVIDKLGGKGSVVEIDGPAGAGFKAPFKAAFDEALRGTDVRVLASESSGVGIGNVEGERAMTAILGKQREFDALFAVNDALVLGALQAMSQAGIDPATKVIVGSDATPDVLQWVKQGKVTATIDNDAREQGRQALRFLVEYIQEKKTPPNQIVHVAPKLITREPQG